MKTTIKIGTVEDFLSRGKKLARQLDLGETIAAEFIVTAEDPDDIEDDIKICNNKDNPKAG